MLFDAPVGGRPQSGRGSLRAATPAASLEPPLGTPFGGRRLERSRRRSRPLRGPDLGGIGRLGAKSTRAQIDAFFVRRRGGRGVSERQVASPSVLSPKRAVFSTMNPDFLKKPIITEKTTRLIEQKQYAFDVDLKLNKYQIKKIFEDYYGVAIKSIQTYKKKKIKRVILRFKKEISIFEQ